MSGYWQITGSTSFPSPTIAAPAAAAAAGTQIRVRSLSFSATAAGVMTITDSNGPTVIWQMNSAAFSQSDLDVRGSVGGSLTLALTGVSAWNVQGDYVPIGYPYGLT